MDKIHQLIAKHFAEDISSEEMSQLRGWLDASAENKMLFDDLKQKWDALELSSSSNDKTRVLNNVKERIRAEKKKSEKSVRNLFYGNWYRLAASVALTISLGSLAYYQLSEPFSILNTIGYEVKECEAGENSVFLLADGSQIVMNGDSRVKYKENLPGIERNIYLEGEAFFDVARNEQKPFVINMDGANVKVLGTSFNVKAYPDDETMETSVLTGKVAFTPTKGILNKEKESIFLIPGDKGFINEKRNQVDKLNVDNQLDIAWMKKNLNFSNTALADLTKSLYRMYGVKFKFTDNDLKDLKITASFENEKLEEVMKILEMTSEFSYQIKNDLIVIGGENEF
ncbi:FecR family protein [Labilibaculum sp. DW002]|uniref:FecR family protein n=1 Tax=Paralabilibaculum antarcticum TaxID=2912572 RepID=A0ABT5VNB6_9BACT|nr:FecR family protein [Labilibaculum sp. DW002]MDE5416929.1 FecR family protein [Labilibaculum sp. DW002]